MGECDHDWKRDGGGAGWETHNSFTCAKCGADKLRWLEASLVVTRAALEWYADYGQGAAKDPQPLPSQGVALGALHHDGGKRALVALGRA